MLPVLIDEGLPGQVAVALRELGLDAHAIGHAGAPPRKSVDSVNVEWCSRRGAVLVTNDWGRKDPIILQLLAQHRVHAIFVRKDLRAAPPHKLALALLKAEERIDQLAGGKKLIHHILNSGGRLQGR